MNTLFNITARAQQLARALEEDELTPELENELVINQQELQIKAENYAYAIKSLEGDVSIIDEEIKRLKGLKDAKNNAIDRMKGSVVNAFQIYGITEVKSATLKLSLRRSESVEVVNIDQLPESLVTVKKTVSADKVKIKEAIKNGVPVEGAVIVENYSLQIK
jgi:phage terminase small subunit